MNPTCRAFLFALISVFTIGGAPATPVSAWGNLADPIFVRVDNSELSSGDVEAVAQDSLGFIWVNTGGGLARFDGYHFREYAPNANDPNALPEGVVTILADPNGGLWLGSRSSGLVRLDAATDTFHTWHADPADRNGPRSAAIRALAMASDGRVWIGGDAGLDSFDPRASKFARAVLPSANHPVVQSLAIDRKQGVWAGTDRGLFYRARGAALFQRFKLETRDADNAGIPVWSLYEDNAGRIWAGSVNSVYVVSRDRSTVDALQSSDAPGDVAVGVQTAIAQASSAAMWIGSSQGSLSIVDTTSLHVLRKVAGNRNYPGGLTADRFWQLLRDRSGLIWIAGYNGGLLFHNPLVRGVYSLPAVRAESGLNNTPARAVAAAPNGRVWVGGLDGSLVQLDPHAGRATVLEVPKDRGAITALANGPGDVVWIGTQQGLCALRTAKSIECPAGPPQVGNAWVRAILDADGSLQIGTRTGLIVRDETTGTTAVYRHASTRLPLTNNDVTSVFRDRNRRLWAGTQNGLNLVDAPNRSVVQWTSQIGNPNSIGPGAVEAIVQDDARRIWAAAYGSPSSLLRETGNGHFSLHQFPRSNRMGSANVDSLIVDAKGTIWASMDARGNGIAAIDPVTMTVRTLGPAEGVSIDAYSHGAVTQLPDGTIFFGGLGGLTAIAPGARLSYDSAPPLMVTALKVDGRPVPAWPVNHGGAPIELPGGGHNVSVEFAALDYTDPQALRYAYRLDGFDTDWIDADALHRVASYTNLGPGRYKLRVRTTNRLGAWSSHELALRIVALPAWYETWWFRTIAAILAALALFLIYRARTDALRRRARELEAIVAVRTHDLADANGKLSDSLDELKRTQVQLVAQEKMAGIGTLTAGVAHEINNPANFAHVGALTLRSDLERFRLHLMELTGDGAPADVIADLNERFDRLELRAGTIAEGTTRITNLVKDLRAFSRLDEADRKTVRIGDSLESTINLVRVQYSDVAEIVLELRANPELECWPALLNQVFMNVIVNACQAIAAEKRRRGGEPYAGELTIRSHIEGDQLIVEFEDNGCGIPAGVISHIFEPFFTTKAVGEGSGLGLSISFGIVEKHGGSIEARSADGNGACFTVRLPLRAQNASLAVEEPDRAVI